MLLITLICYNCVPTGCKHVHVVLPGIININNNNNNININIWGKPYRAVLQNPVYISLPIYHIYGTYSPFGPRWAPINAERADVMPADEKSEVV